MYRYSKYFIILFFALAVFPLILMFFLHHNHSKHMHDMHSERIFAMATKQLKNNLALCAENNYVDFDLNKAFPSGPFKLELYEGDNISRETFIDDVIDRYAPPPMRGFKGADLGLPKDDNSPFVIFKIKDQDGNVEKTLLFKMLYHKPPFEFLDFAFWVLMVGILSSFVLGLFLKNSFLTPLVRLANSLEELHRGNLDLHLETNYKQGELNKVFKIFNKVVSSLKEKDELRNNFISNLTHDLRTPLISQERTLELISKEFEDLGMKETYNLSKSLEKNNQHLLRMVNLILEAYRFDARDLNLHFEYLDMKELIDECFIQLDILAKDKNITLENKVSKDLAEIKADKNCLRRVFINLISNSIANIPSGGMVEVGFEFLGGAFEIFVKDNGNGIAQEDLVHIFDRYYVGKGYDRNIGSGLGLYVSQELVKLHQGEISVESKKGAFTKFTIKLPV